MYRLICLFLLLLGALEAKTGAIVFHYSEKIVELHREDVIEYLVQFFSIPQEEAVEALKQARIVRQRGGLEYAFWEDFAEKKGKEISPGWMKEFAIVKFQSIQMNPDIVEVIKHYKEKGKRIGLLVYTPQVKNHLLKTMGALSYFDEVFFDSTLSSTDLSVFQTVVERLHVLPKECLFIDHQSWTVQAAKKSGLKGIVFDTTQELKELLMKSSGLNDSESDLSLMP